MSHIGEALKRRSLPPTHAPEPTLSGGVDSAEDRPVLERYVSESRVAEAPPVVPSIPLAAPVHEVPARGAPAQPVAGPQIELDGPSAAKLVVSSSVSPHSIVQYRRVAAALAHWKTK